MSWPAVQHKPASASNPSGRAALRLRASPCSKTSSGQAKNNNIRFAHAHPDSAKAPRRFATADEIAATIVYSAGSPFRPPRERQCARTAAKCGRCLAWLSKSIGGWKAVILMGKKKTKAKLEQDAGAEREAVLNERESRPFGESQLMRLKTQLASVELLLAHADRGRVDRRPESGKWSAREILAHIGRYHEVFLERVRRILTEPVPHFARYRAEEDPSWPEWASRPVGEIRAPLTALRTELIGELTRLRSSDFSKVGVHSSFGEMTLTLWLEFFLVHEAHHLYVMLQCLRES